MKRNYVSSQRQFLGSLRSRIGKTAVILPSTVMTEMGIGMTNLGLIFYMREVRQLPAAGIGWFASTWLICYVISCLFLRPIIGRIVPRYGMIGSTATMALCALSILFVPSLPLCFVLYGIYGLAMSFFWPPLMGWLSFGVEGTELGKAMARLTIVGSLGITFSPFLAGLLSEISVSLPIFMSVLFFVSTASLVTGASMVLPRIRDDSETENTPQPNGSGEDRSTLLRFPAWIGLFGSCVVLGIILNIFPVYASTDLGLEKSTIGALMLTRAFGTGIGYIILGRISVWHFKPAPMIGGLFTIMLFILLLPWMRSILLLGTTMLLIGPFHSLAFSYSFFHGVTGSTRRSQRMAIHEGLLASGIITGSAAGGMIYQSSSMFIVSLFGATIAVAVAVAQIYLSIRARKQEGLRRS